MFSGGVNGSMLCAVPKMNPPPGAYSWMSFFAPDAVRLTLGGKIVQGLPAVMEQDSNIFADSTRRLTWEPTGAGVFDDTQGKIAQDKATSVVFGMPGAAAESGLADVVLPVDAIANQLRAETFQALKNRDPSIRVTKRR